MQRLKEVRKALHLTTEDVAQEIGVTNATVSRWENGKMYVSEERYAQLADVYGCSVDDLRNRPNMSPEAVKMADSASKMIIGVDTIEVDDPKLGHMVFHTKSPAQAGLIAECFNKICRLSDENLIRLSERISVMLESQEAK